MSKRLPPGPDAPLPGGESPAPSARDAPSNPLRDFRRFSPAQRWAALHASPPRAGDARPLAMAAWQTLPVESAERMVENVVGVFGLPYAVVLHLLVDGIARRVPMVVEEASIVAAQSAAAKLVSRAGGVVTQADENLLVGQIHLRHVPDAEAAREQVMAEHSAWRARANALCPRLVRRGGGVRDMTARVVRAPEGAPSLLVHLHVDTCDAMGANTVNSLCEALAVPLAKAVGAEEMLSILSNLTERALVHARVCIPLALLARPPFAAERVRDGIVAVSALAEASAHRAVTHNKGIMNGVDALALATGNDWRAIEANAHAYAGRGEGYRPLSQWAVDDEGALVGTLCMPLKVGTKGGNYAINPSVAASWPLLGLDTADALRRTMAAVGLLQNFAALRALGTEGIQRGHMALHARSVAASAGVPAHAADAVVAAMLADGEITIERARAASGSESRARASNAPAPSGGTPVPAARPAAADRGAGPGDEGAAALGEAVSADAPGKVLLFGEHAVVYGAHAVAVPFPLACTARVQRRRAGGVRLRIAAWGIDAQIGREPEVGGVHHSLHVLLAKMGLLRQSLSLTIEPNVPRGMGLGSSAALAVSVVRALAAAYSMPVMDEEVMSLAFEAEKVAHATPSGVDNALCALGRPIVFCREHVPPVRPLTLNQPLYLAIGLCASGGSTARMVRQVRAAKEAHPALYASIFARIDALATEGIDAIGAGAWKDLGKLMNLNHGLLHALDLSTPALEGLIFRARETGALGAKLTGAGGGGAVVALCRDAPSVQRVCDAWTQDGRHSVACTVPATSPAGAIADGGCRAG